MPRKSCLLTGWATGARAEKLKGHEKDFVSDKALGALTRLLKLRRSELERLLESAHPTTGKMTRGRVEPTAM